MLGALSKHELLFADSQVTAAQLGQMLDTLSSGKITGMYRKYYLQYLADSQKYTGTSAKAILYNLTSPSNQASLEDLLSAHLGDNVAEDLVDQLISAHPKQVQQIRDGQEKVIQYLVGQGMRQSKGKANAKALADEFRVRLLPNS